MKDIDALSSAVGFIAGLVAAWFWWRASRIKIDPYIQPTGAENDAWVGEAKGAFSRSSALNAKAALWTAISVASAALSAVLNFLNSN